MTENKDPPSMKRMGLNLTQILASLLTELATESQRELGPFVEELLRSHPRVSRAAKKRQIEFAERRKPGRRWT